MGSRPRNSTQKRKQRSVKASDATSSPSSEPTDSERFEEAASEVVGQLDETWSVLKVALKALDNIHELDERRVDAPVAVKPDDVAIVLRVGLACLEDARHALQNRVVEGKL
jgi:hypothetical protein